MEAQAQFRSVRAAVFAAVCVGVSGVGHALASGHAVPTGAALLGAAVVFGFARAAAGRERGYGPIAAWMLWGQLALHAVFSAAQAAGAPHTAGHTAHTGGGDSSDPGMLAAHLLAALVSAWWLRRGEAAAFTLLRLVTDAVLAALPAPVGPGARLAPPPRAARPCGGPEAARRTTRLLRHAVVLRAPPLSRPAA
ncbi:hypothetical protein [Nocardiopsis potens]|uniref:hypothetical protein n=1 Tax=Nocardiopsis potens TaxID=1246458 RepID=UPI000345C4F9|nr:hypothetical protein [Nocardiopsis potens]